MNMSVLISIMLASILVACSAQQLFLDIENTLSDAPTQLTEEFSLDDYEPIHPLADNATYGNIEQIHTIHFHLDWEINFHKKQIYGTITHDLDIIGDTRVLQLDAWDIDILAVK